MATPYDYRINVPDPYERVMQGVQIGAAFKQQQVAKQRAEQQKATMQAVSENPTAANISKAIFQYPELADNYKKGFDVLDQGKKQATLTNASQVYAALQSGNLDAANTALQEQADAARNSGDEQGAKHAEAMQAIIKVRPEAAQSAAGMYLASAMGPDKFAETFTKLEQERRDANKAPAELSEAESKAQKAATEARFAESNAVMELRKKGWDISKIQNDIQIDRQNVKIAAINAQLQKEQNQLKRDELQQKLDDAKLAREQVINEKATAVESARNTIDNSLNTIDRLLKNPALNDVVGPLEGREGYPTTLMAINNPIGTSSEERANAIADIDTIKSQTFLSQLVALKNASATGASGLGALSQQEGERLVNGVQSLQTKQGEAQFKKNLAEVQRLLLKMRGNVARKYGVPDTIADRPEVQTTPESSEIPVPSTGGYKVIGVKR